MAPEPLHLVNITKACPHCNSTAVKFCYYNNNLLTQPRYKCKGCGKHFTYGGKTRPPYVPRVVRPPRASTTSTAVAAADHRTGPARRGRPRRSQPVTPNSGAREIQETPATSARTEARTVARTCAQTRARTEARTVAARNMARPSTGALRLRRIPISKQPESPIQSPVRSPVVSSVESPAVLAPFAIARIAGLVPGDIVDVDQRPASRTAPTVVAQGGDVMVNWTKAVLGVPPYRLKRMRLVRIKFGGHELVVPFGVEDSDDESVSA